jgi:thioredoxin-related protein
MRKHKGGGSATSGFTTGGVIVAVFLVAVAGFAVYWWMNKRNDCKVKKEGFSDDAIESSEHLNTCDKTKSKYTIMFFHMDTCPHCKDFEPAWNQFESYAQTNDMLSRTLCATRVSADDRDTCRKFKIQGFPTVFLVNNKSGDKTEFKGARTLDALKNFVLQNVS